MVVDPDGDNGLPPGRYEALMTRRLAADVQILANRAKHRPLTREESPAFLTRHIQRVLRKLWADTSTGGGGLVPQQVALVNALIAELRRLAGAPPAMEEIAEEAALLLSVSDVVAGLGQPLELPVPLTPLTENALFTNAPSDPGIGHELEREIGSADGIDLVCAFITWTGLRGSLRDVLAEAHNRGVPIRVLTTSYRGVTQPRALDELVQLGAQV